jgi:hypothetical protein
MLEPSNFGSAAGFVETTTRQSKWTRLSCIVACYNPEPMPDRYRHNCDHSVCDVSYAGTVTELG